MADTLELTRGDGRVREQQLTIPEVMDPDVNSADNETSQQSQPLSWKNCLALGCDNANVMTDQHKGVYGYMKKHHENLHLAGCPCHLLHRAAERACSELPFNIDEVLVDVYYYLDKSSKRQASLEKFQEDVKHQNILKHVATRWLSVRKCVGRLLENWDALKSFIEEEVQSVGSGSGTSASAASASTCISPAPSSQARLRRLEDLFRSRTNRLHCLFLFKALEPFDILNQQLQNESPQIHILHRVLLRFLRQYLTKFVKPSAMVGKCALDVEFSKSYLLKDDKELFIGEDANTYIEDKEHNHPRDKKIKEFYSCVRKFWGSACTYMKTKFPFHSDVLKHAKVTDIKIRAVSGPDGAQTSDLEFFLERFPCLIPAGVSKQTVLEESAEYQSDNLTQIISDPQFEETRNDVLWESIGNLVISV